MDRRPVGWRDGGRSQLPCDLPRAFEGHFNPKLGIALEEADESLYWLEVVCESKIVEPELLKPHITEAGELVAILVASVKHSRVE